MQYITSQLSNLDKEKNAGVDAYVIDEECTNNTFHSLGIEISGAADKI